MILFNEIISTENLLAAWEEFVRGKRTKTDIQLFERNLMDNILQLNAELANRTYLHGPYQKFRICDPKLRDIHKALVRDRLLHHAIHRVLYPIFDQKFIHDSFSCRVGKGVHAAGLQFRRFAYKTSQNHTRTCWVLKCDIRKFFASIRHNILINILQRSCDRDIVWLLKQIIESFATEPGHGLPLGNLTSQLLANIYLNEFDQFVKQYLKTKFYLRYADDFVILSRNRDNLLELLPKIEDFLCNQLKLELHLGKVSIETIASGVDFLGWKYFPTHKVVRTATKRRMFRRINKYPRHQTVDSYIGLLSHGNAHGLQIAVKNLQLLYG